MKLNFVALISLLLCGGIALAQTKAPAASAPAASGPEAIIETSAGTMHCTLFPKQAPNAVANFVGLATGTKDWTNPVSHMKKHGVPLYNGTIFHRVIPDFMIQGGDPAGNGSGDPGYAIKDEIVPTLKFDRAGRLAYANSGPNTNGSQFFITEVPTPFLDGKYTILGQCDPATVTLVKQIARMPRDQSNDRPYKPVVIKQITIKDAGTASKPAARKPAAGTKKTPKQ